MTNKKVTVRPCKEQAGKWEIQEPSGQVMSKHFNSKEECVSEARRMAYEFGLDVCVENEANTNQRQMNK